MCGSVCGRRGHNGAVPAGTRVHLCGRRGWKAVSGFGAGFRIYTFAERKLPFRIVEFYTC